MSKQLTAAVLHAVVQFLLIRGIQRISGRNFCYFTVIAAAAIGGVYSYGCMLPRFHFLGNGFWHLICLGIMACIAFYGPGMLGSGAVYILMSLSVSAVSLGNQGVLPSVLALVLVVGICLLVRWDRRTGDYIPVVLRYGGREMTLTALRDTGNNLRDPITGQAVLVVDGKTATALTGLTTEELRMPYNTLGCLPGSRLIPYNAVGQPNGLLLAARFPDVSVGNWRGSCLVAFAPDGFGDEKFQVLVGGTL